MAAQFQKLLPPSFLALAQAAAGIKRNNSLYSPLVVLWLLIAQRLHGGASLEIAVNELFHGLPASFWPRPCKRLRDWRQRGIAPSSNTGAYNQARQSLPLIMVQACSDHIFNQLLERFGQPPTEDSPQAFLLDGSTIRMAHTPELRKRYPPGSNQYGESHWPLLRILVAHDLYSGLAMRPEWGPMHGEHAVSEQSLLEKALDRLPAGATVIGDANFGIFSVAYAATQSQRQVLLRLTVERARRMAGGNLHDGIDQAVSWKPSRADRQSHPDLPLDAEVQGRLMVRLVQPDNGGTPFLLSLFTSLPGKIEQLYKLYGKRWTIETDLRTLKSTLGLDQLTCLTPDMVAKEIDMGIVAYNMVRAMIGFASEQSGIPPRGYRFTTVRRILQTFGPQLASAPNQKVAKQITDTMMLCIQRAKVPKRNRKRPSYPRAVWQRKHDFPKNKKSNA